EVEALELRPLHGLALAAEPQRVAGLRVDALAGRERLGEAAREVARQRLELGDDGVEHRVADSSGDPARDLQLRERTGEAARPLSNREGRDLREAARDAHRLAGVEREQDR